MTNNSHIARKVQFHQVIKNFDYDQIVDWAIELIQSGHETINTLILASFSKPVSSEEIIPYLQKVIAELNLEEKQGEKAIFELIHCYMHEIIVDINIRSNLTHLYDFSFEYDDDGNPKYDLLEFSLLYYTWNDLDETGFDYYFYELTLDTIEPFIKNKAQQWIDNHPLEKTFQHSANYNSLNQVIEIKQFKNS